MTIKAMRTRNGNDTTYQHWASTCSNNPRAIIQYAHIDMHRKGSLL